MKRSVKILLIYPNNYVSLSNSLINFINLHTWSVFDFWKLSSIATDWNNFEKIDEC